MTRQAAGGRGGRGPGRTIDLSKPVLLTAYGQWTKKAGYYELNGKELNQARLRGQDLRRSITKAKKADRLLFTRETFVDFPNYFVTDTKFANPKRMTDANPQQSEYKWGHRILFEFKNKKGVRLQGTLAIPDDYQQGQKLPMLVNFYEKNSQNLHAYTAPAYASSPQFAGFVSQGYLVMQPDIHFNTRTSHSDMLECVEAAVQKVIDMGYADPEADRPSRPQLQRPGLRLHFHPVEDVRRHRGRRRRLRPGQRFQPDLEDERHEPAPLRHLWPGPVRHESLRRPPAVHRSVRRIPCPDDEHARCCCCMAPTTVRSSGCRRSSSTTPCASTGRT